MLIKSSLIESVEQDGYAMATDLADSTFVSEALNCIEQIPRDVSSVRKRKGATFAVRNILALSPNLANLATASLLMPAAQSLVVGELRLVRAILFDKTPEANWSVPWHQDTTIAVQSRCDVAGFGPWSVKSGIVHCQPPASVLQNMITVRVHLDACDQSNGALRVIAASDRLGILKATEVTDVARCSPAVSCDAKCGDALFMRPLLIHASSQMTRPARRRVLHFEFAGGDLPGPLRWASAS